MDKFFDSGNPVMRFLTRLVDLAILNIMTVVFSLPIITFGASLTAMNFVLLHLYRKDETYVTRMFKKSFRDNLKQGIPEGMIALATAIIASVDLWAMHASQSRLMTLMMIIITVIGGFLFVTFVYMFALQSRYVNSVKATVTNAFRLALGNLPRTAAMMIIWIAWILVLVYLHRAALLAFLIYGYTIPGYLCTILYEPVFKELEKDEQEDPEQDSAAEVL